MKNLPKSYRANLPTDDPVLTSFVQAQRNGLPVALTMLIHDFVGRYGAVDALALLSQPRGRDLFADNSQPDRELIQTPAKKPAPRKPKPVAQEPAPAIPPAHSMPEKRADNQPEKKESAPVSQPTPQPPAVEPAIADESIPETTEDLLGISWS